MMTQLMYRGIENQGRLSEWRPVTPGVLDVQKFSVLELEMRQRPGKGERFGYKSTEFEVMDGIIHQDSDREVMAVRAVANDTHVVHMFMTLDEIVKLIRNGVEG